MLDRHFLAELQAIVLQAAEPIAGVEGQPLLLVPPGYTVNDMEALRHRPRRTKAKTQLQTRDSFVGYLHAFSPALQQAMEPLPGQVKIWCDHPNATFFAILDYHQADAAAWCQHQAAYQCQTTNEFKTWVGSSGKKMDQAEFAEFLDQNQKDIVEPDGAALIEIAQNLSDKREVSYSSAIRLTDGQTQFQYHEEINGGGRPGHVRVPAKFKLGVQVFEGSDHFQIEANLRYRIVDRKLVFWYELVRPHLILKAALALEVEYVQKQTGLSVWFGKVTV